MSKGLIAVIVGCVSVLFICSLCSILSFILFLREGSSTTISGATSEETVENFLGADTKQGEFSTSGVEADGVDFEEETGEFWISGEEFRIDNYEADGTLRISIISSDGIPYFCKPDEKECVPSVAPKEYYLSLFKDPMIAFSSTSEDEESNCTLFIYEINELYDMEGSSNQWYNESATYCASKETVKYIESRGSVPEDDGTLPISDIVRYTLSNVEIGSDISDEIFKLPYAKSN